MPKLLPDYPGSRRGPRFAYLRSFLPVIVLILLFSLLLASYSLLSYLTSPVAKQQLGWQAWDIVRVSKGSVGASGVNGSATGEDALGLSLPLDNWVSATNITRRSSADLPGSCGAAHYGKWVLKLPEQVWNDVADKQSRKSP